MRTSLGRPSAALTLRVAALLCGVVAAWGPRLAAPRPAHRVVVVDVSASALPANDVLRTAALGLGRGDRLSAVLFARGARLPEGARALDPEAWRRACDTADGTWPRPAPDASDLAAGLRAAAALVAADAESAACEVLLLSDLRATSSASDVTAAAAELRASGCTACAVHALPSRALEPYVAALRGPGRARRGDTFVLAATGAAGAGGARVQLLRDDRAIDARDVPPGPFHVAFEVRAEQAGELVHEVRAGAVSARARTVVVDDRAAALVVADGPLRAPLAAALADMHVAAVTHADEFASQLAASDVVVLDGVAAARLGADADSRLADAVARGLGLVVLGGPDGFARGGWAGTAVDRASPLRSTAPDAPAPFLYLALDGSASVAEAWPGGAGTRDAAARDAARALVAALPADVDLALRRFADRLLPDGRPAWRAPLADRAAARAAIDALPAPAGGTALLPVLAEAARLAATRGDGARHCLVLTDGRTGEDAAALAERVAALVRSGCGVTLLLDDVDGQRRLGPDWERAGARVVLVTDAAALGAHFVEAAARGLSGEDALSDVELRPVGGAAPPPAHALPARAARVQRTHPADDADALLATTDGVVVAAVRRHGAGRVAALATRPGDAAWLADDAATRELVASLAGWARAPGGPGAALECHDERVVVRASRGSAPAAVAFDGGPPVALVPASGGTWTARFPAGEPRPEHATVLDAGGVALGVFGVDRPAPPEYQPVVPVDPELLRAAGGAAPRGGVALRPWAAAAAVLLVLAAQVLAGAARRRAHV